jgi:hypothetical protein
MATTRLRRRLRGARGLWGATPRRPGSAARAGRALVVLSWVAFTGCGVTDAGTGARGPVLYVSNSLDGTVSRVDARAGRIVGTPVPAGTAPWHLALGPAGSLHVEPVPTGPEARLTFLARAPAGGQPRPLSLEPGARRPLLAGGGHVAAVAYASQGGERPAGEPGPRCRVAPVDLALGRVTSTRDVCSGRDSVVGLTAGDDGTLVYLAVWRRPPASEPCGVATGSRGVALRPDMGAAVAVAPLAGVPGSLTLAPAPGGVGHRLYAGEALPSDEVTRPGELPTGCASASHDDLFEGAPGWRVWGLNATTLAPDVVDAVPHPVRALAVTPDGEDAFVLAGRAVVLRLPPGDGPATPFAVLPDLSMGLAATDERLYTLDVFGDRMWGLDRRRGTLVQTIPTGRRPLDLATSETGTR